ncbi:ketose-bisphosphate aldolase class-ii family protein [Phlyctema vagabunda]|uniref:Ketose-bisphosphate aldolase class-ii family protein n=1 Tax=Phlyctema vagabunda TaxID=108571 RepID=A0ABR4P1R8_9HELO
MAFGSKLGLDTNSLYEIIKNAAGGSWMFENRVPAILNADWTPHSQLAIFVKDMGIVLDEAKRLAYFTPLSAAAHQLYMMGASHGWSGEADGGVVRVWELMTGISVAESAKPPQPTFKPREYLMLPKNETIASLPPVTTEVSDIINVIDGLISNEKTPLLIALDDDPTGTQTCHDIPVLTVWDHGTLCAEFRSSKKGFFILTNSRALPGPEAKILISTICQNLSRAAAETKKSFQIVLRGDSTLRGHFPEEPESVEESLGKPDAWILAPFFFQGGRYTIDDVHYVAEKDVLVPASQTPFAQDATFGYRSSNLRDYVREKAGSRFAEKDLFSITLEDIRVGGYERIAERLLQAPKGSVVIVNAAAESDMFIFAAGAISAEQSGKKYLYRTGAAFVSARLGISGKPPMSARELDMNYGSKATGGLIIAGSYVPKTTAQLESLRERRGNRLHVVELDVGKLIKSDDEAESILKDAVGVASRTIEEGDDVLIMTSRSLILGADAISSLKIGGIVAAALVKILKSILIRPRYIIAKGGITSSDAATKGLNMKRALILGQAAPGVPIWRCDEETSRHTGVPYIVFPGNVGGNDELADLVERWAIV